MCAGVGAAGLPRASLAGSHWARWPRPTTRMATAFQPILIRMATPGITAIRRIPTATRRTTATAATPPTPTRRVTTGHAGIIATIAEPLPSELYRCIARPRAQAARGLTLSETKRWLEVAEANQIKVD